MNSKTADDWKKKKSAAASYAFAAWTALLKHKLSFQAASTARRQAQGHI